MDDETPDNLVALNSKGVTPQVVLRSALADVVNLKEVFIVGLDHDG